MKIGVKTLSYALLASCISLASTAAENSFDVVEGTAEDYSFVYKTLDSKGNVVSKYYKIQMNSENLGTSTSVVWHEVETAGDKTVAVKLPNSETKYYQYSYEKPDNYTTVTERIDNTLTSENSKDVVFENTNKSAIINYVDNNDVDIKADFINNVSTSYGGAIYNTGSLGNITGDFIGNRADKGSGAIYNKGTIKDITGDFIDNKGRALENDGKINNINGNFIGNSSGGLLNSGQIQSVNGDFISNATEYSGSGLNNKGTIKSVNGDFVNNYSRVFGGGLYNIGTIDSVKGSFIGNHVADKKYPHGSGGAIQNGATGSGHIGTIEGDFIDNRIDVTMDVEATYGKGAYYAQGGAIFNETSSSIDKIKGNFVNNSVYSDGYADGGAIHNSMGSTIGEIEGSFVDNHSIVAEDSEHYAQGGAIQNLASSKINKISGDFIGNYAKGASTASGGAITNSKSAEIGQIKGSFVDNYVETSEGGRYSQGGAIYNSSNASIKNIEGGFYNNHASNSMTAGGGAIYNNGAKFEQIKGDFIKNYASGETYAGGGALYNYYGTIGEVDGSFVDNYAKAENGTAKGGAIFSLGSTTLVADGKTNIISGNYVEDRNGKRNEGIYVSTGEKYLTNTNELKKVDNASGYGFYNKYSDYVESEVPALTESKLDIVAKNNGTFIINDAINGDSTAGIIDYDVTNYYSNWNGTQRVYVDRNDEFLARYDAVVTNEDVVVGVDETGADKLGKKTTTTIEYRLTNDKTAPVAAKEVRVEIPDLGQVTSTFYDADGNEISELPVEITDKIAGKMEYNVNFKGDETGSVYLNNDVLNGANVSLDNTNLYLGVRDNVLNGNNLTLNGGSFNMINGAVGVSALNSLTVKNNTNFTADVDLANQTMDRFTANEYGKHTGNLNVVGMNLISDAPADRDRTEIYFAEPGLKDYVTAGMKEVPDSNYQLTGYSPIYKYDVGYENRNDAGYFTFSRKPTDSFNPAVLATPVATQAGGQSVINETIRFAFQHMDMFSQLPSAMRISLINENKYAISEGTPVYRNDFEFIDKGFWLKPFTSFESINLKGGPDVDAITYGALIGHDGKFREMKHGWYNVQTLYGGYNGSQLSYGGVDTNMNGGVLGVTETFYKGNFFSAFTGTAGMNFGTSSTMYGNEDFSALLAGIGTKTGYNFEFKDGKYIIQPIMFMNYSFVNTFDYTNAAGVKIESDPLHTFQINPQVKFVANMKNGWQPYAHVGFVWNVLNSTKVRANDIILPNMSVDPYVEYGLGLQKVWKDKFTGFAQAMVRNGGRNGVALTFGFRWALGKDNDDL